MLLVGSRRRKSGYFSVHSAILLLVSFYRISLFEEYNLIDKRNWYKRLINAYSLVKLARIVVDIRDKSFKTYLEFCLLYILFLCIILVLLLLLECERLRQDCQFTLVLQNIRNYYCSSRHSLKLYVFLYCSLLVC